MAGVAHSLNRRFRVLIAEDSEAIVRSFSYLIASDPSLELAGVATDGLDVLEKVLALKADVVLMDNGLPYMDGTEATRRITGEFPGTVVIGMSGIDDEREAMLNAGAADFIEKIAAYRKLIPAIKGALAAREAGGGGRLEQE